MNTSTRFADALRRLPLVAILRGLTPAEAPAIGAALFDGGFCIMEVPLNSPRPLDSIAALAAAHADALVGAGTVMSAAQVRDVHGAGGQLIVSPHFDPAVVREAVRLGLVCLPGIATPTEAFGALAAGAHGLKLFPAEMLAPVVLKAMMAVLPAGTPIFPVGGINAQNMAPWRAAGASGFGLGTALYLPGKSADAVRQDAQRFAAVYREMLLA